MLFYIFDTFAELPPAPLRFIDSFLLITLSIDGFVDFYTYDAPVGAVGGL